VGGGRGGCECGCGGEGGRRRARAWVVGVGVSYMERSRVRLGTSEGDEGVKGEGEEEIGERGGRKDGKETGIRWAVGGEGVM